MMSRLASRSGKDVDGGVGDEQRLGISRHVHDEDVTDPPRRAQPGLARRHLAHQFVGMQAALHQKLAFGLAQKLDRFRRGGFAVGDVDQLKSADVQSVLPGDRADLGGRSDEYRDDDSGLGRLDDAAKRGLVAGVRHHGSCRDTLGSRDQTIVFRPRRLT